jgi:hypothetical protein
MRNIAVDNTLKVPENVGILRGVPLPSAFKNRLDCFFGQILRFEATWQLSFA